jgi:endonuclease/exonuclease/phosphatase family metal-dependent hydrolase
MYFIVAPFVRFVTSLTGSRRATSGGIDKTWRKGIGVPEQLRVASFNIRTSRGRDGGNRWRRRREICISAIRGFAADVVGLQEVRPDQLRHLRRAFPDGAFLGGGRDADGGGERASILVNGPDWIVQSSETRWLSPTPTVPGSLGWDANLTRVVTLARLRRGATVLGVANTHFDDKGAVARDHSADLIAGWLAEEPERPWVVLGDLNAVPTSAPLRRLAEAGWSDPLPTAAGGTEHSFTGATDRNRIDYVLAGPGVQVSRAWIDHVRPEGRLPSDHWPVLADLLVS